MRNLQMNVRDESTEKAQQSIHQRRTAGRAIVHELRVYQNTARQLVITG